MKKVIFSILFVSLFANSTNFSQTKVEKDTEKVRRSATKIGTGQTAKVLVTLRTSSILKGYIGAINNESFSLVNEKNGASQEIKFVDVEKIKKRDWSHRSTIITLAVAGGIAAIIIGIFARQATSY